MERIVKIKHGIDPRNIASLVQLCSTFKSEIKLEYGTKIANTKSIMGMISLSILEACDVTLIAVGSDEEKALDQIGEFLESI